MAKNHRIVAGGRFVMRSLFRTTGGYWIGRVRDTQTGRVRKISTRKKKKPEAETALIRWCEDYVANQKDREEKRHVDGVMFSPAFAEWLSLKSVRPSTLRDLEYSFDRIYKPRFGGHYLDEVEPKEIERFLRDLERKRNCAAKTRHKHLSTLRSFFGWAMRHRHCRMNPTEGIRVSRVAKRHGYALSEEEAQSLLRASRDKVVLEVEDKRRGPWKQSWQPPPHLHLAIAIGLFTGLRRGNILGLKWKHVDLGNRRLSISAEEMKANADIVLPIHKDLHKLFEGMLRGGKRPPAADSFVLGEELGEIKTSFHTALSRAGLPRIRWHDLRHTYASWLSTRCSFACLRELLGHSPGGMITLRYTHVTWQEKLDAIDAVPRLFGKRNRCKKKYS